MRSRHDHLFALLGFSENEARVYRTLLRRGTSSMAELAVHTKLHRPSLHRALTSLAEQGYVSTTPRGKRMWYVASQPGTLRGKLAEAFEQAEGEIPHLEYTYEKRPNTPVVTVLEGKQAIAYAYLTIPHSLKRGDVYYRYSARDAVNRRDPMDPRVIASYRRERDRKQLERFVITSEANVRSKRPELTRAMKMVPPSFDLFDQNVSQIIYGNRVLLIDYSSQTAIQIESPSIAHFHKRLFELMFRLLPETRST